MKSNSLKRCVWIGLAKVEPIRKRTVVGKCRGAFVNVLGLAISSTQFRIRVKQAFNELGLRLRRLEDTEKFDRRIRHNAVADELKVIARALTESRQVGFGKFHNYP